jgi:hypothetical protein
VLYEAKSPQPEQSQDHKIRKQKWGQGWDAIDEIIEGMDRRPGQIPLSVQYKAPNADSSFQQQHGCAQHQEPVRYANQEGCDQKSHRDGAGYDWNLLQPVEETVSGLVGEAENEVSDKASER